MQLIAAMTLVAELQDFMRFESPRQLMAFVGLVPGEHSSGPKRRQGSITKAGNSAARRMLVEIAWHYQHSAAGQPDHRHAPAISCPRPSPISPGPRSCACMPSSSASGTPPHEEQGRRRRRTRARWLRMGHRLRGPDLGLARSRGRARELQRWADRTERKYRLAGQPKGGKQPSYCIRCRRGNAAQPRPPGNPRQRYWWAVPWRQRLQAISDPRAKAAPRRKLVLRYPTLEYQHEQPSHIHHGWQPLAPSRSPSGNRGSITSAIAEDRARPLDKKKPYQRLT